MEDGYLFQGDMVMTKENIETAINCGDVDKPQHLSNLSGGETMLTC